MARKTGKFLDKSSVIDSEDENIGQLAVPGAEVVEIQEESWGSIILGWVKGIIGFIILFALLAAGLFTGLGMTVLTYSPLKPDSSDRNIVLRGAWADTGGKPPVGTIIAVSGSKDAPTGDNWWEWIPIAWVGIPDSSVVEVVSTDYDKLYVEGTIDDATVTIVNNPKTSGPFALSRYAPLDTKYEEGESFRENIQLKNSYLVECKVGNCERGTYFVVGKEQIYGEVR